MDESILEGTDRVMSDSVSKIKQRLDSMVRRTQKGDLQDALKKFNEVVTELNKVVNALVKGHTEVQDPANKVLDRMHKLHESVKPLRTNIEKGP